MYVIAPCLMGPSMDRANTIGDGVYVFWIFSFLIGFVLLQRNKTKILLFEDKIMSQGIFQTKEIEYSLIQKVAIGTPYASRKNKRTFFVLYSSEDTVLMTIPLNLFDTAEKKTEFLRVIQRKNLSVSLDKACSYIIQGTAKFQHMHDILAKKVSSIVQYFIVGVIFIIVYVPILLSLISEYLP